MTVGAPFASILTVTTGNPRLLLVDNEDAVRELLRLSLLPLGVEVLDASNLAEARRLLDPPPDLVVIDFYLDPEAGTDLLEEIPEGVPVLMVTASVETKNLMAKYPRLTAVLDKPFDGRTLRQTVRGLIPGLTAE